MAFPGGNTSWLGSPSLQQITWQHLTGSVLVAIPVLFIALALALRPIVAGKDESINHVGPGRIKSLVVFIYGCFLKPHRPVNHSQQDALESFYEAQAGVYDSTRDRLLLGRREMLALALAQLRFKLEAGRRPNGTRKGNMIWVDVGGGTGWNIEAMSAFVDVPVFFKKVYLVDFSPSLCQIARRRFERLQWTNVEVFCEDARHFRLPVHGSTHDNAGIIPSSADLVTLSYSLSMIPDYFSIVDSVAALLAPSGVLGVVDFFAQSRADFRFRNYTGGVACRHVGYWARSFWRAWFDIDHVMLGPGRRDYIEYRFGTVLNLNLRNRALGFIPYYIWIGRHRDLTESPGSVAHTTLEPHAIIDRIDAAIIEAPLPSPCHQPLIRSRAYELALQNLLEGTPLPSFFYQNHHWRIHYDDGLAKYTQFKDEYIYAFTWEDSRADEQLLSLRPNDVVLALTSAGDNILSYLRQSPARIHAVDLNPTQNHLLELKLAAYASAIPYDDFWRLFGDGRHPGFRELLLSRLSPHLSSRAFQYWFHHAHIFAAAPGGGLYPESGGTRHVLRCFRWVSRLFGLQRVIRSLLVCETLNEQRELWRNRIRPALFSRLVCRLTISRKSFLWAALGVHSNQLSMIEEATNDGPDNSMLKHNANHGRYAAPEPEASPGQSRSHVVLRYLRESIEPVAEQSHIASDNPYYYVCLAGQYSHRCHPEYLSPEVHRILTRPGAFECLTIHTDELNEVIERMSTGSLTVAVIMDSMDWFDRHSDAAATQIAALNRVMTLGGRVLLRSSALTPWYVAVFETNGFSPKCVGARSPGYLIDRVNMYASTWICTKGRDIGSG